MATISIEENVVIIEDAQKSKEILTALNGNEQAFATIKPAVEDTKVKETIKKWFGR